MTISYPLTLPTITGFSSITIKPVSVVGVSRSVFTLEEQVQVHQGQAWEASVSLPVMKRADAEEWIAFFLSLNGIQGTFLMGDPLGATARGSASTTPGTPVVNGAGQTGNTLAINGCPNNATNYLRKGDYVQLGSASSSRLHRVLTDASTDGAGAVTLDIWPNLRESPSNGGTVVVANTVGLFRLKPPVSFPTDSAKIYELRFECIESI
jgi:hypothetical protein